MKTIQRIDMATVYDSVAESFRASGDYSPTHCDVRCAVNDVLESYRRGGCLVAEHYSQDRAFSTVRRLLSLRS